MLWNFLVSVTSQRFFSTIGLPALPAKIVPVNMILWKQHQTDFVMTDKILNFEYEMEKKTGLLG